MFDKRLIQTVPNSKRWIHTVVLWQWLGLLASIIAAFTFGLCIEGAYYETLTKVQMMYRLMILICTLCARAYCAHMATKASYHASTQVKHHLRTLMYNKLTEMPLSQSQSLKTSSIMQTASEGVEQLEVYFARYVPQFYYSLLAPLTLFLALVCLNFKTALVLLICVPLIPLSIIIVSKIAKRLLGKYWGVYINLGSRFLDNLQGLTTSKIYQDDEHKNNIMNEEAENFRQMTMRVLTMQLNSVSIMDLLAYGGSAVGIMIALLEFQTHQLSIAGVVIFILLSSEFFI
ncbi:MAG: ABC transporter transmembrane domain-containing protein, partial [Alcaligenaceae bacterium]|nr:ABC transporter transmembrane domain-containing protein [Alcaligenaceae bacterium]